MGETTGLKQAQPIGNYSALSDKFGVKVSDEGMNDIPAGSDAVAKPFKMGHQLAVMPAFRQIMVFHDDALEFFDGLRFRAQQDIEFRPFTIQLDQVDRFQLIGSQHFLQADGLNCIPAGSSSLQSHCW